MPKPVKIRAGVYALDKILQAENGATIHRDFVAQIFDPLNSGVLCYGIASNGVVELVANRKLRRAFIGKIGFIGREYTRLKHWCEGALD